MECLHNNDVLKWKRFPFAFLKSFAYSVEDNIVKIIPFLTDSRKQLKCCIIHAGPVVGDVTL